MVSVTDDQCSSRPMITFQLKSTAAASWSVLISFPHRVGG